jgi:hypothetical protein
VLGSKIPDLPLSILLHKSTNNGTKNGTTDGREDDEGNSVLLLIGLPHIGNHTKSNRTTSRRQTTESTTSHDGSKVLCESDRDLPDVDKEQTELEDRPSTKLLGPGSPELTTKGVKDKEDHSTTTGSLSADVELFRHTSDGIAVKTGVEVHRYLDDEDDRQNRPFLPSREAEAKLFVAIIFCQNDLVAVVSFFACLLLAGRYFGVVDSAFDRRFSRVGILDLFVLEHAGHVESCVG